MLIEINRNHCS